MPICCIGAIVETDLDAILTIERQSFKRAWQRSAFLEELACDYAYGYAVRCKTDYNSAQIIGYICFQIISAEMHLLRIAVAPRWRRRGIATWLLGKCFTLALEKGAEAAFLEVRPSNRSAISLYRKLGFHLVAKRSNYYRETREDALILKKHLKEVL